MPVIIESRRKQGGCKCTPLRFTAAGNADRKPFLRVPAQFFLGATLFEVGIKEFGGIDTDSENKQRVSLYLDKKTMQVVDSFIKKNGLHSRNESFERAGENLIADEAIKAGGDVMSEKLAKAVENVSDDNAKAISKGLLRYAVQLEMLMRIIAKTNHFTDDEPEDMRREAINNVRRTRGKIKLDDIAKGWYNEK